VGVDNTYLVELVQEVVNANKLKQQDGMNIYVMSSTSWLGGWEKALSKQPRSTNSVIFDVDHAEHILSDAKKFLTSGEWYASMGIPYRRGYLLYGPPGNFI